MRRYDAILKFQLIYFLEKIRLTCEAHNSLKELKLCGGKSSLVSMHAQAFAFFLGGMEVVHSIGSLSFHHICIMSAYVYMAQVTYELLHISCM